MILKTMSRRSKSLGKMLMICSVLAGFVAGIGTAQENASENDCTGAEMGSYANLGFCLPPDVTVEAESMAVANYSAGSEVWATMLLDGNRVGLHLLYPCQAPGRELEPAELKPYLEDYDPIFVQAIYNESVTSPILPGQVGNQRFIANQRNNQTIALVLMDMNMSEILMTTFLGNLSILVNEEVAPASNCQDTTGTATEEAIASEPAVEGNETSVTAAVETTVQTPEEKIATGRDKMLADTQAAQARMKELMNR